MSTRGPWADWPEMLAQERLQMYMSQNAEIMETIRPPIPNLETVAPRFGFVKRPLSIHDVVRIDDVYRTPNTDPLTQRPSYSSSALPGWSSG